MSESGKEPTDGAPGEPTVQPGAADDGTAPQHQGDRPPEQTGVSSPIPGPAEGAAAEGVVAAMGDPPPTVPEDTPRTVVSGRADFATRLDAFHGPLDLLLYLIKENEVDITNIPIAFVLDQYLKYIDAAEELDLHLAGEFLVMATTLMEIKSRELLPVQEVVEGEELIEDPRSELVRQLLRYRQVKDRARNLEARLDQWQQRRSRGLLDEIPEAAPDEQEPAPMPDIDLYELLTIFERLRKSVLAQVPRQVGYEGENLEEKVTRIERTLKDRPFARFNELVLDLTSRPDIALTFIALLELVRRRMIRLMQDGAFGNLEVKVQTEQEAEALAHLEAQAADQVVDVAMRDKSEREAKLLAEAEAMGVAVDQLPWKRRRAALARPKFEGIVRPEDVEELDAEEVEISRRIDAILAAADAISQRFEESRDGAVVPVQPPAPDGPAAVRAEGPSLSDGGKAQAESDDDRPLTEDDLAPRPERPPEEEPA